MSKIQVNKCKYCGRLFEDEKEYDDHIAQEEVIVTIKNRYKPVIDKGCKFANGGYSKQRTEEYCKEYKKEVSSAVKKFHKIKYEPFSYAWMRTLDDSGSLFYGVACRALYFCPKCSKEWGQMYYTNKCCS